MIAHTSGFKTAITNLGRELYVKINYYNIVYNLITEDDKLIITQDNLELLSEEMEAPTPSGELTNNDIIMLKKNNLGELFRTYMKSFDLETPHRFNVGDKMIVQIGTKVNDDVEYLNYGTYYVYQREYNEDTQTYTYTLCDKMILTMIKYDNNAVFGGSDNMSCTQLMTSILNHCGFTGYIDFDSHNFANPNATIYKETFDGLDMTCRDVLDMLTQTQGCSLVISYNEGTQTDYITNKIASQQVVEIIDENILKDTNIKVNQKFGKINSLLFKRANGFDNLEKKDQASIDANGLCQYAIENNLILEQENRQDFLNNLYDFIKDIQYYTCDIETIGLGYIEYLDMFKIQTPDNQYNCLCLKNTMEIKNGMKEIFTTEEPLGKTQTYENGYTSDKDASILLNKLKGEIVLKTDSDGKLAQVRLDSSGDEGSLVEVTADQINLAGKDIDLTGDNITISSDKFNVDENGNMECRNAILKGIIKFDADNIGDNRIYFPNATEDYTAIQIQGQRNTSCDVYPNLFRLQGLSSSNTIYIGDWDTNKFGIVVEGSGYTEYNDDGQHIHSDRRSKDNITDIDKKQSINIITNLKPVTYNYKKGTETHRGLIAQDVEEILNKEGIKNQIYDYNEEKDAYTLNYTELIPDLINCIKYQQEQIEELKKEVNKLKGGKK